MQLAEARGQIDAQLGRITQLEQALDQTLAGLAEARSALAEQAYLEAHLAEVEQTANVQWQAIVQLKRQLLPCLEDNPPEASLSSELASRLNAHASTHLPQATPGIMASGLGSTPEATQEQLAGLEAELAKQMQTQALLQQACLELESERAEQQARLTELEQQSVEMQEQILSQAQQASEDETAIQHWKDRAAHSQSELAELRALLAQAGLLPPQG
jgi:DNA repair exonuclease SbcCD ATPase subunit